MNSHVDFVVLKLMFSTSLENGLLQYIIWQHEVPSYLTSPTTSKLLEVRDV